MPLLFDSDGKRYCIKPHTCLWFWLIADTNRNKKVNILENWYCRHLKRLLQLPVPLLSMMVQYLPLGNLSEQCDRSEIYNEGWEIALGIPKDKQKFYEQEDFPLAYLGRFEYAS